MKACWTHKYTPEPGFVKELSAYDPCLEVFWDGEKNDWVITRKGKTGYHEIGHYTNLNNRTLESLYEGDLWRFRKSKEFDQYIENNNSKIKEEVINRWHGNSEERLRKLYVDNIREHKKIF